MLLSKFTPISVSTVIPPTMSMIAAVDKAQPYGSQIKKSSYYVTKTVLMLHYELVLGVISHYTGTKFDHMYCDFKVGCDSMDK